MRWKWPWLPPRRGDAIAVAALLALGAAVLMALVLFPGVTRSVNYGFGPDWDCKAMPKGGPVCVRKHAGP